MPGAFIRGDVPVQRTRRPASTPPSRALSVPPLASVALDGQLSAHATPLVLPGGFTRRCFSLRRDRPRRRRRGCIVARAPTTRYRSRRIVSVDEESVPASRVRCDPRVTCVTHRLTEFPIVNRVRAKRQTMAEAS